MGLISKTPMNLVHQFLIRTPKPDLKSNKGEENKTEKGKEVKQTHSRLGPPAHSNRQPRGPASAPQQAGPRARVGPAASQHAAHARTPLSPRLQPLPHGPRMSALLFIFSTPRPRPLTPIPLSDRAPTALAGAGQGVTPGA